MDAVGGWDELLGADSRFEGAGDRDLVYRVLGAGYLLLHLPAATVTHRGFRDWQTGGRPVGLGRLWALLNGFLASFSIPIDPATKRYVVHGTEPDMLPRATAQCEPILPDRRAG